MKLSVPVNLSSWDDAVHQVSGNWPRALLLLRQAVETVCIPKSWRKSEYAMTKVTATEALADIEKQLAAGVSAVVLDLFAWSVLEGELARLLLATPHRNADLVALAVAIRGELLNHPEAAARIAEGEEYHKLQRRLERDRRKIERLEQQMRERELKLRQHRRSEE